MTDISDWAPDADAQRAGPPRAESQPPPPFEAMEGYWVEREEFTGQKSFGLFQCEKKGKRGKLPCTKRWKSAHAQKDFGQGCQACNTFTKPWLMWHNTVQHEKREKKNPDDERAAHDRARCEACARGVCTVDLTENLCHLAF